MKRSRLFQIKNIFCFIKNNRLEKYLSKPIVLRTSTSQIITKLKGKSQEKITKSTHLQETEDHHRTSYYKKFLQNKEQELAKMTYLMPKDKFNFSFMDAPEELNEIKNISLKEKEESKEFHELINIENRKN